MECAHWVGCTVGVRNPIPRVAELTHTRSPPPTPCRSRTRGPTRTARTTPYSGCGRTRSSLRASASGCPPPRAQDRTCVPAGHLEHGDTAAWTQGEDGERMGRVGVVLLGRGAWVRWNAPPKPHTHSHPHPPHAPPSCDNVGGRCPLGACTTHGSVVVTSTISVGMA
jgi:hypothetical protein